MSGNIWFTADHHWNHPKIIELGVRPFRTVEEMNAALIQQWVDVVKRGDRVYHLGDVAFSGFETIVDQLPGQLFLLIGNHDSKKIANHPRWIWAREGACIVVNKQRIHLSHYPFESWRGSHRGSWHLHGHSHGNLRVLGRRMDVGVDTNKLYAPWSFAEVSELMKERSFVQVDHHAERMN